MDVSPVFESVAGSAEKSSEIGQSRKNCALYGDFLGVWLSEAEILV